MLLELLFVRVHPKKAWLVEVINHLSVLCECFCSKFYVQFSLAGKTNRHAKTKSSFLLINVWNDNRTISVKLPYLINLISTPSHSV